MKRLPVVMQEPQHRCADYRDIGNAILADQSGVDHGEAAQGFFSKQRSHLHGPAPRVRMPLLCAQRSNPARFLSIGDDG